MIECTELSGKVVRLLTLYDNGKEGAEVNIEFTDGSVFSASLTSSTSLEAKHTLDEGGLPSVLKDYTAPEIPR
jgi:hypothetical protein